MRQRAERGTLAPTDRRDGLLNSADEPSKDATLSRFLLVCLAALWGVWVVVSPLAWMGCVFRLPPFTLSCPITVHFTIAADVDESKVSVMYGDLSGDEQGQVCLTRPAGGWAKNDTYCVAPKDTSHHLVFTVTGYDDKGNLICLGRAESTGGSDVTIDLHATIPWT